MRIIGGEHKGRRIAAPKGRATRPMLDRVREAVFSAVASWVPGARVLDLFAGSGSLGLEALSRGAAAARLVERDPRTAALVRRNAAELGVEERIHVVQGDALAPLAWGEGPVELVFLDPPYPLLADPQARARLLSALEALLHRVLAPDGLIVFHAPRGALDAGALPAALEASERRYGSNAIWLLTPRAEETP